VLGRSRRARAARPDAVDPWALPPPWRDHLRAALDAQGRFDLAARSLGDGATRDRIEPYRARIDSSVRQAALAAQRAAMLASPQRTTLAAALSAELADLGARPPATDDATIRHEAAVAAQLRALRRAEAVSAQTVDQLRILAARIDDATTALIEVSIERARTEAEDDGAAPLLSVFDEIEALQAGIEASNEALGRAHRGGELGPGAPEDGSPASEGTPRS